MTLSEFKSMFYSRPTIIPPATIYAFTGEDDADSWIGDMYFGENNGDYELSCVIRSDMVAEYFLNDSFSKAEVQQFYAVEPDVIVVVVELYYGKEGDSE